MKHGRPVFSRFRSRICCSNYDDGVVSSSKAARMADLPVERFLGALASAGVDAVSYAARTSAVGSSR